MLALLSVYVLTLGNYITLHMTDIDNENFLDIVEYEGVTFVF